MNDMHDITEQHAAEAPVAASRAIVSQLKIPTPNISSSLQVTDEKSDKSNARPPMETTREAWHDLKEALHDLKTSALHLHSTARYHSVSNTPAVVVNNSSNLLGAAHVMTEMMMFKASLKDGKLFDPSKGAIYGRTVYPIRKVYVESIKSARDSSVNIADLMRGNPVKNVYNYVTDTKAATAREIEHQTVTLGKPLGKVSLGNRWQTRSTLAGLTVWGLSAIIPDKKESDEEVERMEILRRTNLLGYVGERFKQAVWIPGWPDHKREMIGAGILVSGICSTFGSWRNRDKLSAVPKYIFNGGYFGTAMLTLASAFPLLFASDDQRGFGGFGTIMTGRLMFLPKSIYNKFKAKEEGVYWYTAATGGFQLENWAQSLIGGAEKVRDPKTGEYKTVDHEADRKAAKDKALAYKAEKSKHEGVSTETFFENNQSSLTSPSTTVSTVTDLSHAMPARVEAHDKQQAAV